MVSEYDPIDLASLDVPIIVAELGTAHNGELKCGLELVDAAADSGADIVKVQVVFADEILPPQAGLVPLQEGSIPLYDVLRSLECSSDFYAALAARAAQRGIGFLASPFGKQSVQLLNKIGVQAWKVASPELNHEPLLEELAHTGLPIILSTGVSRIEDVHRAMEVIYRAAGSTEKSRVLLLHCITSYPAPRKESNLMAIPRMRKEYGVDVGFSDHSTDVVLIPALAAALGAVMIEKHFTLNKKSGGLDDSVALTPSGFSRMAAAIRSIAALNSEDAIISLREEFGTHLVESVLGDGSLGLAPSEVENYGRTNRSIHSVGFLVAGTIVTPLNTAILRTEKVLRPGIAPRHRHDVYGRRLRVAIKAGDGITWNDLE